KRRRECLALPGWTGTPTPAPSPVFLIASRYADVIDTCPGPQGKALMNGWTSEELSKIGKAEELRIRSLRRNGTLRSPTIIWVVRHGEDLYVRPVNGRTSGWFRGTQVRQEGHIQCGGVDKDVTF